MRNKLNKIEIYSYAPNIVFVTYVTYHCIQMRNKLNRTELKFIFVFKGRRESEQGGASVLVLLSVWSRVLFAPSGSNGVRAWGGYQSRC